VPLSTQALLRKYHGSRLYQDLMAEFSERNVAVSEWHQVQLPEARAAQGSKGGKAAGGALLSLFTRAQYFSPCSLSGWFHTKQCFQRQATAMSARWAR